MFKLVKILIFCWKKLLKKFKMKQKEKGASLLGNMLTGKGAGYGKRMLRDGYGSKMDF